MSSEFGARFDLEVDAFFILALAILAWQYDKAGVWVIMSGLLRYLFLAPGAAWKWLKAPLKPNRRRQAVCVAQIVGLLLALITSPPASTLVAAAALLALCCSFLIDIVWLRRVETAHV